MTLPEQGGCNVPRCGVWPIYKEGLCGSHYMKKHCPREGEYVSKYDPLPEQGGFNEKLEEILERFRACAKHEDDVLQAFSDECITKSQTKAAIRTLVLEELESKAERLFEWDGGQYEPVDAVPLSVIKKLDDTHGTK